MGTFNFYYSFFFCHLIYGICIIGNLAPDFARGGVAESEASRLAPDYLLTRIFLSPKRAFRLDVNHIHYHLIQTSDLQTSLNLVPFAQLASKFTCIFGYHILNSTCPDFFVEDFLFTHTRDSARDKHILRYHNNPLRHKIVTSFNALPYITFNIPYRTYNILETYSFTP